jgi:hypothetical protein
MNKTTNGALDNANQSAAQKLPYERPLVVSEEVFETTALACGKDNGQPLPCDVGFFKS